MRMNVHSQRAPWIAYREIEPDDVGPAAASDPAARALDAEGNESAKRDSRFDLEQSGTRHAQLELSAIGSTDGKTPSSCGGPVRACLGFRIHYGMAQHSTGRRDDLPLSGHIR